MGLLESSPFQMFTWHSANRRTPLNTDPLGGSSSLIAELGTSAVLRPIALDDVAVIFRAVDQNRGHLNPWLPWVAHTTSERDTHEFVVGALARERAGDAVTVVIEESGKFCGLVGLDPIDHVNRSTPVGYWICRDAQGRGFVSRAVAALAQYAFDELDLNRICLSAAVENERSRAVARRLGFSEEGILRESQRHSDRFVDLVSYSLLRDDDTTALGIA